MKAKIKRSELSELVAAIEGVLYNPFTDGSIPGCDCGCGGDVVDYDVAEETLAGDEDFVAKFLEVIDD